MFEITKNVFMMTSNDDYHALVFPRTTFIKLILHQNVQDMLQRLPK